MIDIATRKLITTTTDPGIGSDPRPSWINEIALLAKMDNGEGNIISGWQQPTDINAIWFVPGNDPANARGHIRLWNPTTKRWDRANPTLWAFLFCRIAHIVPLTAEQISEALDGLFGNDLWRTWIGIPDGYIKDVMVADDANIDGHKLKDASVPWGKITGAPTPDSFSQVNADWNATAGPALILNKPAIPSGATGGVWDGAINYTPNSNVALDTGFSGANGRFRLQFDSAGEEVKFYAKRGAGTDIVAISSTAEVATLPSAPDPSNAGFTLPSRWQVDLDIKDNNAMVSAISTTQKMVMSAQTITGTGSLSVYPFRGGYPTTVGWGITWARVA